MELVRGYRKAKSQTNIRNLQNRRPRNHHHDTLLVINLPDLKVLRVMSRSVFLAVVILSLPCIRSIIRGPSSSGSLFLKADDYDYGLIHFEFFQDLINEGLIKKGDKALVFGFRNLEPLIPSLQFLNDNEIELVVESDYEKLGSNDSFDLALLSSSLDTKFIDRVVKIGGIVIVELSNEIEDGYEKEKQSNYRIGYLHRYNTTILAMRKIDLAIDSLMKTQPSLQMKKAALKDLEDVLFEPPRSGLSNSKKSLLNKMRFLPELLGSSVASFSRRVFIDVSLEGEKGGIMEWFHHNYPMGNQEFEMYSLEMVAEDDDSSELALCIEVSDWLNKNVREEEYVVMKAEAEVAEEMIKKKTIRLVDELFLECKNQWQDEGKTIKNKSKRTYWECLSLYGRLRDEGVAVHQWWG